MRIVFIKSGTMTVPNGDDDVKVFRAEIGDTIELEDKIAQRFVDRGIALELRGELDLRGVL